MGDVGSGFRRGVGGYRNRDKCRALRFGRDPCTIVVENITSNSPNIIGT